MSLHLSPDHLLAGVASRHCLGHRAPLLGGVACGECWERAIRDDESLAVHCQLPRELAADPELVDDVAVQRAMAGHREVLTRTERRAAIGRLDQAGVSPVEIARLLHTNSSGVRRELDRLAAHAGAA